MCAAKPKAKNDVVKLYDQTNFPTLMPFQRTTLLMSAKPVPRDHDALISDSGLAHKRGELQEKVWSSNAGKRRQSRGECERKWHFVWAHPVSASAAGAGNAGSWRGLKLRCGTYGTQVAVRVWVEE